MLHLLTLLDKKMPECLVPVMNMATKLTLWPNVREVHCKGGRSLDVVGCWQLVLIEVLVKRKRQINLAVFHCDV